MNANELKYEDIAVGNTYQFEHRITKAQVGVFAQLTGDVNPLHVDEEFASKSSYGKNLVHGMLAGSLFSRLIGMYCPGRDALYLRQTLDFKGPIFCDDVVTVKGTVISKVDSVKMIELKTEILKQGEVVLTGTAKAKMVDNE